jgi:hypothetical protein
LLDHLQSLALNSINDTYALPENVSDLMAIGIEKLSFIKNPNCKPIKEYVWLHASFV